MWNKVTQGQEMTPSCGVREDFWKEGRDRTRDPWPSIVFPWAGWQSRGEGWKSIPKVARTLLASH